MNFAEDVSDSMSCGSWDAWKEKVKKQHETDKDFFTDDMDNMSCMDAWVLYVNHSGLSEVEVGTCCL